MIFMKPLLYCWWLTVNAAADSVSSAAPIIHFVAVMWFPVVLIGAGRESRPDAQTIAVEWSTTFANTVSVDTTRTASATYTIDSNPKYPDPCVIACPSSPFGV
jgi:hypothetical protein